MPYGNNYLFNSAARSDNHRWTRLSASKFLPLGRMLRTRLGQHTWLCDVQGIGILLRRHLRFYRSERSWRRESLSLLD
jgi:hypothetical protein